MRKMSYRAAVLGGLFLFISSGCTVKQQQDVLAGVGTLIPGSKNSLVYPESSSSSSQGASVPVATQTSAGPTQTVAASPPPTPPPAPRNDLGQTDAQLVLQTMQRAMKDNPAPFIECLDNTPCRSAFTTHLIRLQKLAGGTLELPPVYERYDLQRGKE
jgi:hypothetical protein